MKKILPVIITLLFFTIFFLEQLESDETDETCFMCHGDNELYKEENGRKVSLYVSESSYYSSVHKENGCISCHSDIDPEEIPHESDLEKVDCEPCHSEPVEHFNRSLHGKALKHGKYLAPNCARCHGKHNILSAENENSRTYVMNIPDLCGKCHKEGTSVSKLRGISKDHILENYSQSIHGDGLFKRGLIVTAVCNSCHTSHDILPHEDSRSSINRNNIATTCMQCHRQINEVHKRVIRGELWQKSPNKIPICADCHQPHKVRRVDYAYSYPDKFCMDCHKKENIHKVENGEKINLHVNLNTLTHSVHEKFTCVNCHTNIDPGMDPVCKGSGKIDCSICHTEQVNEYKESMHGLEYAQGNENAPYCTNCHPGHDTKKSSDINSKIFSINIPKLCGECHNQGTAVDSLMSEEGKAAFKNYKMSIHGKGLLESGLTVTATCIDCHTAHHELPISNPNSSIHPSKIAHTCGNCHIGIYEAFKSSIHSPEVTNIDKELPVCNDCHQSHTIERVDESDFRNEIISRCGRCHQDVTETYFETFHGKVSNLGSGKTAKCSDCHGAHNILPVENPNSTLSRENVIETCKQCHPQSNRKFVGYLTHATHHDKDKYPFLFYTFWFMTILLVSTFGFFGIHTLLWLPRGFAELRKEKQKRKAELKAEAEKQIHDAEEEISEDEPDNTDSQDVQDSDNDINPNNSESDEDENDKK